MRQRQWRCTIRSPAVFSRTGCFDAPASVLSSKVANRHLPRARICPLWRCQRHRFLRQFIITGAAPVAIYQRWENTLPALRFAQTEPPSANVSAIGLPQRRSSVCSVPVRLVAILLLRIVQAAEILQDTLLKQLSLVDEGDAQNHQQRPLQLRLPDPAGRYAQTRQASSRSSSASIGSLAY